MEHEDGAPLALADFQRAPFAKQLAILTDRSVVVARREPLAYLVRLVANFSATLFFGIIYIETRDKVQAQINPRTFFLMFCVGIPMQFILVSNFIYHYQWLSLKKEVKDGMYHPAANAVASWIVQAPMMFVLALTSLLPMFVIGLFAFLNIYFVAFLFCGMFVDPEDVVWPIRVFCYFLPLGWSLQSYMYGLYHDLPKHSGTMPCVPGTALATGGVCTSQGFYCYSEDDPTGAVCYGESGDQILNSLSVQFTIFGDEGYYARNILFIVAFGALTRIAYLYAVYYLTKINGGKEPAPPSEKAHEVMIEPESDGEEHSHRGGVVAVVGIEGSETKVEVDANAPQDAVSFSFRDISYSIPVKNEPDARILRDVSATVNEGEVLAIVGPSGAGKTILLDTLTFSKGPGAAAGEISLCGEKMTREMFVKQAIYVPREDNLWPTMTPRDHLEFAFKMYKPDLDAAQLAVEVNELLNVTGLTSCADTRAGGFLFKGLSGGQRRRLSLAVALVKQPRVIVLDEPTSGLDSAAAAAIISLLDSIATRRRAAVVCTIHQPSALVFAGFHKVLVLSEGRVAYCGERGDMASYFGAIGAPLSHDANPAEAVLDLVSKDTTSPAEVTKILDAWDASDASVKTSEAAAPHGGKAPAASSAATMSVASARHVFARQVRLAAVDPLQYIGRIAVIPGIVSFFGLVYVASHKSNQKQVPFRLFYMWWVLALPACMAISTLIGTSRDTVSVIYEIRAGMYKAWSYALSTSLVQIPALLVLSFSILVCAFAIGGWPFDNYVTSALVFMLHLWSFDSVAQLLAVVFENPVIGMLAFLGYWSSSIVFCGLVFRGEDVVWPFRSFYYALPLKWTFNAMAWDVYTPDEFSGATECVPGDVIDAAAGTVCTAAGFYCEGLTTSFGCWGRTGAQVLRTLHMSYESINAGDDRWLDVGVLLLIVFLMKVGYVVVLWAKVTATAAPTAPVRAAK